MSEMIQAGANGSGRAVGRVEELRLARQAGREADRPGRLC